MRSKLLFTIVSDVESLVSTTWKGVKGDVQYIHDTNSAHPKVLTYEVNFPTTTQFIIEEFRTHLRAIRATQFQGAPAPKAVAIIDAISSKPGIRFPWPEMIRICREEGAYSLIDAAHCMGQELDINLSVSQPDFWITVRVGSCFRITAPSSKPPSELPQMALR